VWSNRQIIAGFPPRALRSSSVFRNTFNTGLDGNIISATVRWTRGRFSTPAIRAQFLRESDPDSKRLGLPDRVWGKDFTSSGGSVMRFAKLSPAFLLFLVLLVGFSLSAFAPQITTTASAANKLVYYQFAPYYSTAPDSQAMIELNNASQMAFSVTPTLYNPKGRSLQLPPIPLSGHSHKSFDLSDWVANAGGDFQSGSLRLEHDGVGPFALGAQIEISNPSKHFYLDVPLVFKQMFASSQLQAIWWRPGRDAELKFAVMNTSDGPQQAVVTVTITGEDAVHSQTLNLAAHESRILNLRELLAGDNDGAAAGGITIQHNGAPSAVVAEGWIFDPHSRFPGELPFVDTATYAASQLSGAGVMLGSEEQFPGSLFEGHLLVRNTSDSAPLTATPVLQRGQIKASLGKIILQPGETKEITVAPSFLTNSSKAAGIEVGNSGAPAALIADWFSVDRYSGIVVETPVRNVSTPRGGNNPWMLDGDFTSVLYVKNTRDKAAEFVSKIWHAQGEYTIGLTEVGPGETAAIDIRKLRDEGVKDWEGHMLPPQITSGQVQWQRNSGPLLIGRVLTASQSLAMASNMSCGTTCCCSPRTATVALIPSSDTSLVGQNMQQQAKETDTACDGTTTTYSLNTSTMTWSSSNAPVASVNTSGYVSCLAPGSAIITGTKFVSTVKKTICDGGIGCCSCLDTSHNQSGNDNMNVTPKITSLSPAQGVAGTTISVTINGTGLTGSGLSVSAGSDITVSISSSSNTQIQASFNISGTATGGNHSVKVTVANQTSNGANFYVQIPTSLSIVTGTNSTTAEASCSAGSAGTGCGMSRTFTYQVNDQAGQPIHFAGLQVWDAISVTSPNNLLINSFQTTCTPANTGPCGVVTDSNGQFKEQPGLSVCSTVCRVNNACTTGGPTNATQTVHVGSASITQQLSYYCDHITVNGQ
jgi:hypothetical protein